MKIAKMYVIFYLVLYVIYKNEIKRWTKSKTIRIQSL